MISGFGPMLDDLPGWSGTNTNCRKCGSYTYPSSRWNYDAISGDEYLERKCGACGYRWFEKCADTGETDG